jgi:hypothetical protein
VRVATVSANFTSFVRPQVHVAHILDAKCPTHGHRVHRLHNADTKRASVSDMVLRRTGRAGPRVP